MASSPITVTVALVTFCSWGFWNQIRRYSRSLYHCYCFCTHLFVFPTKIGTLCGFRFHAAFFCLAFLVIGHIADT
ncbi:hypothetical protein F5Y18DRAFT_387585 [Xylariaceae sp. FL1019]|nr:hypothetical protein F5Y18DRAFT_387585 [Xylariaceae sp. FL1019]